MHYQANTLFVKVVMNELNYVKMGDNIALRTSPALFDTWSTSIDYEILMNNLSNLTKLKFRNKEVTCTLEDLVRKWKLQKGLCAYSGLKLSLVEKDTKWSESTASIDRINSDYGYHDWNIQWVHKRVNSMKNDMTEDEFIDLVYQINDYMKGIE